MTSTLPPKQRANTYEDSDFEQVIAEIEEADEEIETISATARGKIGAVKTRQKNRKKIASQELKIPTDVLNAVLKQRRLERQLAKISAGVPDDMVELYLDAANQFTFLKPDEEHPEDNAAATAARQRQAAIDAVTEREQVEGAAALDELSKVH